MGRGSWGEKKKEEKKKGGTFLVDFRSADEMGLSNSSWDMIAGGCWKDDFPLLSVPEVNSHHRISESCDRPVDAKGIGL